MAETSTGLDSVSRGLKDRAVRVVEAAIAAVSGAADGSDGAIPDTDLSEARDAASAVPVVGLTLERLPPPRSSIA